MLEPSYFVKIYHIFPIRLICCFMHVCMKVSKSQNASNAQQESSNLQYKHQCKNVFIYQVYHKIFPNNVFDQYDYKFKCFQKQVKQLVSISRLFLVADLDFFLQMKRLASPFVL